MEGMQERLRKYMAKTREIFLESLNIEMPRCCLCEYYTDKKCGQHNCSVYPSTLPCNYFRSNK